MTDVLSLKPPGLVPGRPSATGNRRAGSRNEKTLAAAEPPARPEDVSELFDAGNPGYSIDRRESAVDSR
jgi:hypothetical protein